MTATSEYLIETADRCINIASSGRLLADELSAIPGPARNECAIATAGRELLKELEAISQQLLAKAVEIDTDRQKSMPGEFGP